MCSRARCAPRAGQCGSRCSWCADNGYHLWSETYDRKLDDVFKVQDEIAAEVVRALKVSLLRSLPQSEKPRNADAHAYYLQGYYFQVRDTREDTAKAVSFLERAVQLEPTFASYWAQLSRATTNEYTDSSLSWKGVHDKAHQAADRALALDLRLPEAHVSKGKAYFYLDLDISAASAEFAKARELDPFNLNVVEWTGIIDETEGRYDEALPLFQQVADRDPLSTDAYNSLADLYFRMRRYEDVEAAERKALDLNPATEGARATIGLAMLLRKGNAASALTEIGREPDGDNRVFTLAMANQILGHPEDADKWLSAHEFTEARTDAHNAAELYALRDERDKAFAAMDRAFNLHDSNPLTITGDPFMKSLRDDSRYRALLRKINLPE
jgi:tetratricopeptide (TPR) repeat protein